MALGNGYYLATYTFLMLLRAKDYFLSYKVSIVLLMLSETSLNKHVLEETLYSIVSVKNLKAPRSKHLHLNIFLIKTLTKRTWTIFP